MTLVSINSIRIHGRRQPDGFWLAADGIKGWHDGITYRRNLQPRPQQHGYFDQPAYLDGRTISLHGYCRASTLEQLANYRNLLSGLNANGGLRKFTVQDDIGTLFAQARVDAGLQWTVSRGPILAEWQAQFWAPDPRKYGDERRFVNPGPATGTNSVTVFHRGNFPAVPVHTITGTFPSGYSLLGPNGETYRVNRPLNGSDTHVVDMGTGALTENGTIVYGGTVDVDLWTVLPGGQPQTSFSAPSGSGQVVTTLRDTFI
jgi:hypothetical protein